MFEEKEEQTATCWLKEAQKGYMRIAILILLSNKSSHGYEIMKETGDRTEGFWKPTAGGIYPILKDLEKSGYIEGKWGFEKNRRRKSYSITETGRLILKRVLIKQNQIAESMKVLFEEFARDVLNLETKGLPIPKILTPFSAFLEKEKPSVTTEDLKRKRKHIENAIEMLRSELKSINKTLNKDETAKDVRV